MDRREPLDSAHVDGAGCEGAGPYEGAGPNQGVGLGEGAGLGVVIPALDEADTLPRLLEDLARMRIGHRILVVDGGSGDGTVAAARAGGAEVMRSRAGRARQMNAGAAFLATRWLLFLHADSRLDGSALDAIAHHVRRDAGRAGYFRLAIAHSAFYYRLIEIGQRVREQVSGLVYGDQGLLVRRDVFDAVGGYPDQPIMEDVILCRRLREEDRLTRLPGTVTTSSRRYEEEGRVRAWMRNARTIARFLSGTDPAALAGAYRARRAPGAGAQTIDRGKRAGRATLLVFARAPRPGTVKTRLARTIGDEAAAGLYRRMGRRIVASVEGAPARMVVCYDPPDAEPEMRHWLGPSARKYVPQGGGDLGARLARMFDHAFADADRVLAIGTDAPATDAGRVMHAIEALDTADVVIGPARDGGYYLIGLRRPRPELFRRIRWGTGSVLAETRAEAERLGLGITWLELESDIDTGDDLTPDVLRWLDQEAPPAEAPASP